MALAKLGEKQEMDEILEEAKSLNPLARSRAIEKLGYVANKASIRALIAQLDEPSGFRSNTWKGEDGKTYSGHVIIVPPSYQAMLELEKIVSNPPAYNQTRPSKDNVKKWKEWWKVNSKNYD